MKKLQIACLPDKNVKTFLKLASKILQWRENTDDEWWLITNYLMLQPLFGI